MALNRVRIGDIVVPIRIKCNIPNLNENDVSGINRDKEFFEPSKQVGKDTTDYKIVPPGCFACNLMHVGRDVVLPIAINRTKKNKIVSPAYNVFDLKNEDKILKDYLFIFLNSYEKDRFFWFHTDSSIRDGMDWELFCNIEIEVPSVEIQQKYVDLYVGLLRNMKSFEANIDDIKLFCDLYLDDIKHKFGFTKLKGLIKEINIRNKEFNTDNLKGVDNNGDFIEPKRISIDPESLKIVKNGEIVYNRAVERLTNKFSFAIRNGDPCAVSSSYIVFTSINEEKLLNKYIVLCTSRKEFCRYAKFVSKGSAHENFEFCDLENASIPIPPIEIQKNLVKILDSKQKRREFYFKSKNMIAKICPVLIAGSMKEAEGDESYAN